MKLETRRLLIRPWLEEDAEALYRYASDPLVSEPAMWPCHTSPEMSLDVIKNVFQPNPYAFALTLKENGEAIGCIGLVPEGYEFFPVADGEREIGYWIGRPHWNKGLATEAMSAMAHYLRDRLKLDSLLITTKADNTASQRVALKCGFHHIADTLTDGTPIKAYRLR